MLYIFICICLNYFLTGMPRYSLTWPFLQISKKVLKNLYFLLHLGGGRDAALPTLKTNCSTCDSSSLLVKNRQSFFTHAYAIYASYSFSMFHRFMDFFLYLGVGAFAAHIVLLLLLFFLRYIRLSVRLIHWNWWI